MNYNRSQNIAPPDDEYTYGFVKFFNNDEELEDRHGFDNSYLGWVVMRELGDISRDNVMSEWQSSGNLPQEIVKNRGSVIMQELGPNHYFSVDTEDFETVTKIRSTKPFPDLDHIVVGQPIKDAVDNLLDYFVQQHYVGPQP